jgi:DNA primase
VDIRTLKDRVTIEDVLLHFGWDGQDYGGTNWVKIICPFHWDENPSAGIKGTRFKCWACGVEGDIIDVVGQAESLTVSESKAWIEQNLLEP